MPIVEALESIASDNSIIVHSVQYCEDMVYGCANPECCLLLSSVLSENAMLLSENQSLKDQLAEITQEMQKLFEQANLGSDTSGIPSSKDWKKNGAAEKAEDSTATESDTEPKPQRIADQARNDGA